VAKPSGFPYKEFKRVELKNGAPLAKTSGFAEEDFNRVDILITSIKTGHK
jgi:hypothetical protein